MYLIPLQPVPNQRLALQLDGCTYDVQVKEDLGAMVASIWRDGVAIVGNIPCLPETLIIPYTYLEGPGGNFIFKARGGSYPYYTRFGVDDFLYYLPAAYIAEVRGYDNA